LRKNSSGVGRFDYGYIIHVAERVFVEDVSAYLVIGKTGNNEKCPFCNAVTELNSDAEKIVN
jgi:hypothetical protein